MGYKFYFRDEDNIKGSSWQVADESEYEIVKKSTAFHISTHFLSDVKNGDKAHDDAIRYKGDLWLDIDHKELDNGSTAVAIERSIEDVRKIQKYLLISGVDLKTCEMFASGGKGFHIRIPLKIMSGTPLINLPLVHKKMAEALETRTGATGIDFQMYCLNKGKLIRVENKPRGKNGCFKVQMQWDELDSFTAQDYFDLVKSPRDVKILPEPVGNKVFSSLFVEAILDVEQDNKLSKARETKVDFLKVVPKDFVTTCLTKICSNEGLNKIDGDFNHGKLSLARGLRNFDLSPAKKAELISDFSENWDSSTFTTAQSREREVENAIYWVEKGNKPFSCGYMRELTGSRVCQGCPVRAAELAESSEDFMLEEENNCYYKKPSGKRVDSIKLSNFILEPVEVSYEMDGNGGIENQMYTFRIQYSNPKLQSAICMIRVEDFLSLNKFKSAMRNHPQAEWTGKEEDVTFLRTLVTSEEKLDGVAKVIPVKKLGINRSVDVVAGIDEFVWVEKDWSWNGRLPGTVKFLGPRQSGEVSESTSTAVALRDIHPVETPESARIFKSLMNSRGLKETAILMGWVSACWLKPMITHGDYDPIFPILHAYGTAGSGKTELTKTYSILAGYDGVNNQTVNVSNCTAFYLKTLACSTTTIPQIFDEVNVTKVKNEELYKAIREIVKSTATKQTMGKGRVVGNGGDHSSVITETTVCSSPLIMLSTAQNQEAELIQRAIILFLNKSDVDEKCTTTFIDNYNVVKGAKELLYVYTAMLMERAVSITKEEIRAMWDKTDWIRGCVTDQRHQLAVRKLLVGLQFAVSAFKAKKCCDETVQLVERLYTHGVEEYFADFRYAHLFSDGRNETDNALDFIFGMAQIDDTRTGGAMLKEGIHYIADTNVVHLKINSMYLAFTRLVKEMGTVLEYATAKGFVQALGNCDYYLGSGKTPGVAAPGEWHSFDVQGLTDKGIDVKRLNVR